MKRLIFTIIMSLLFVNVNYLKGETQNDFIVLKDDGNGSNVKTSKQEIDIGTSEGNLKTPQPRLSFIQILVDDTVGGNANGILEPGETATIEVKLFNMGTATAWSVNGTLNSDESGVIFNDRTASFGDIFPGDIVSSQSPHFNISLAASVPCGKDLNLSLELSTTTGEETITTRHALRALPDRDMAAFEEDIIVYGADNEDLAGRSVSSGDINGDGYNDIIMGASGGAGPGNAGYENGEVWVIYSSDALPLTIDLATPPSNTTVIYGADYYDYAGNSVSSGDINGDGYDDVILGAVGGDGPGNTGSLRGEIWVIYGSDSLPMTIDLTSPPSSTTVIYGADDIDYAGSSLSSSDINGDGYDDIILGAYEGDGSGNTGNDNGEVWVIYGSNAVPSTIDLASPPSNTTVIYGADDEDWAGYRVSSGDVNGDDFDDIIFGAYKGDGPENTGNNKGEAWVIFGSVAPPSSIDLATTRLGTTVIYGDDDTDYAGYSVSSGDINGDSYNDIILGAKRGCGPGNNGDLNGEVWVIYGSEIPDSSIDLTFPPENSMVIYGVDNGDAIGEAVSSGDLNGDGYDDLILSAQYGDGPENIGNAIGEIWVIYGSEASPSSIDLASPPSNTSVIYGADEEDRAALCVTSGDLNGNGYNDLILGVTNSDGPDNTGFSNGEVAVFYGKPFFHYYLSGEPYSWIDATTGTDLGLSCDSCCQEIDLGFSFEFYGQSYSKVWICDDGYISFSEVPSPDAWNYCFPEVHSPNNTIGVFWDDLNPGQTGSVFTLLEGTAPNRRLTVEWYQIPHYPDLGDATFEVTLFEGSSHILIQYQDTVFGSGADDGATATAGLENVKGASGQVYSCYAPNLTNGTSWRAIPFGISRLFKEDMESGLNGWTADGLWHQESSACSPNYQSPITSFYYGQSALCDYDTGTTNSGVLSSPNISADYYSFLSHRFRRETEDHVEYDLSFIQIAEDGGMLVNEAQIFNNDGVWSSWSTDISAHSTHDINLGFSFDTVNSGSNSYLGWMIDDVEVWGCEVYGSKAMKAYAYGSTPVCETSQYLLDGTGTYAYGCSGITYQWYEDGSPITGATTLQYVMPAYHPTGLYTYTLEVACAAPFQSDYSDPVSIQVVPMPVEVPEDSFMLTKINGGADIHMVWSDIPDGETYTIYQDTDPADSFDVLAGQGLSGSTGVDITMPPDSVVFYLVAGANQTCGEGPKK